MDNEVRNPPEKAPEDRESDAPDSGDSTLFKEVDFNDDDARKALSANNDLNFKPADDTLATGAYSLPVLSLDEGTMNGGGGASAVDLLDRSNRNIESLSRLLEPGKEIDKDMLQRFGKGEIRELPALVGNAPGDLNRLFGKSETTGEGKAVSPDRPRETEESCEASGRGRDAAILLPDGSRQFVRFDKDGKKTTDTINNKLNTWTEELPDGTKTTRHWDGHNWREAESVKTREDGSIVVNFKKSKEGAPDEPVSAVTDPAKGKFTIKNADGSKIEKEWDGHFYEQVDPPAAQKKVGKPAPAVSETTDNPNPDPEAVKKLGGDITNGASQGAFPDGTPDGSEKSGYVKPEPLTKKETKHVPSLIKELGSDDFKTRQKAQKELLELGSGKDGKPPKDILPQLREAQKNPDLEISRRAERIENELFSKRGDQIPRDVLEDYRQFADSPNHVRHNTKKLNPELRKQYEDWIKKADENAKRIDEKELDHKIDRLQSESNRISKDLPEDIESLGQNGMEARATGERQQALEWLKNQPGEARLNFAMALTRSGNTAEAMKMLAESAEKNPDIAQNLSFLMTAGALNAINNPSFRKMFEGNGGNMQDLEQLSRHYQRRKN